MNLDELVADFRSIADDTAEPYLWSDAEVTRWYNEAEKEACIRARLIYDESNVEICEIAIADDPDGSGIYARTYPLDARIIEVKTAWLTDVDGNHFPMTIKDVTGMNMLDPDWRATTAFMYYLVVGEKSVTLVGTPTKDYTLHLGVDRYPVYDMEVGVDEPEVKAVHHPFLLDWALFRAYSKRDPDTYSPEKAQAAEAKFTRSFGYRPDANVMRKHGERRAPVVKAIGF